MKPSTITIEALTNCLKEIKANSDENFLSSNFLSKQKSFSQIQKKYGIVLPLHHVLIKLGVITTEDKKLKGFHYNWDKSSTYAILDRETVSLILKKAITLKNQMVTLKVYRKKHGLLNNYLTTEELYYMVNLLEQGKDPYEIETSPARILKKYKKEKSPFSTKEVRIDILENFTDNQLWNELKKRGYEGEISKRLD